MITPEFEQWYLEGFEDEAAREHARASLADINAKYSNNSVDNPERPGAESRASQSPGYNVQELDVWISQQINTTREEARGQRVKQALRATLGVIAGLVSWAVCDIICRVVVTFLASIPLLSWVLYAPAGAGWALLVLPGTTAVALGALVCAWICQTARPFAVVVGVFYVVFGVVAVASGAGLLATMIEAGSAIIAAAICFVSKTLD